jgi:molybdopterin molybdotransferase
MKNSKNSTGIKFDDAFEIVMDSARRLGTERVEIDVAFNRILAEDVVSDIDVPPFDKSTRDGFACRRADLANELTVIETIPAGTLPKKAVGPNQCAKIMTGAVVPDGADCVIMVEHIESVGQNKIRLTRNPPYVWRETNIRPRGQDVKKGDVVLRAGCRIGAPHIAVLASHGCIKPLVFLQPRVGIIATGDELVEPSQTPTSCQIRNSNSFQLTAQVRSAGAMATNYGIAVDTEEAIDAMIKKARHQNDVLILSGGVSVGDYDLVRGILEKNDFRLLFERIAVKPGRPTVFGISDQPAPLYCFGLPGNPVSTFVTFGLLVKPFLFKLMGYNFVPPVTHRQLDKTITRKKSERDSWLPVVFTEDNKVAAIEYHGSAHIYALCEANGLLCIPAGVVEIEEGTTVAIRQIQ